MFINAGARNLLLAAERQRFLTEEWPRVQATIQRLGLTPDELQRAAAAAPVTPWPTPQGTPSAAPGENDDSSN